VANLGTAWSLCVWMLPQLVLMIISISQLILIKIIITWVVTFTVGSTAPADMFTTTDILSID